MAIGPLNGSVLQLLIILSLAYFQEARSPYNATAPISSSWMNKPSTPPSDQASFYQVILESENGLGCGFYARYDKNDSFYFAVWSSTADVLWLANGNKPASENATLQLLPEGDLVLTDADGSFVWSTNTSNMSVVGMKMMETGNLVLYDANNKTVWQSFEYPTAQVPTSWTISQLSISSVNSYNRRILFNEIGFVCGFYSYDRQSAGSFYFATWTTGKNDRYPRDVIWLANRNNPVGENATLQLLPEGNLVLKDADGTFVWSTNTFSKSVVGMKLMETGNLVLYDDNNKTVWQSFDYPADVLLTGQNLVPGQRLVASSSQTNRSEGSYYLSVTHQGVIAFYQANVPLMYFKFLVTGTVEGIKLNFHESVNGTLALYILSALSAELDAVVISPVKYSILAYMKFDPDGHLRLYDDSIEEPIDLLADFISECDYPTACGNFGLCNGGQCSCPAGFDSDNISNAQGKYGCSQINPITCENPQSQSLLGLANVSYFNYVDPDAAVLKGTDMESCKQACLQNCSCKVALFQSRYNDPQGNCFLPSPVLALNSDVNGRNNYQSYAFIKISNDGESQIRPSDGESQIRPSDGENRQGSPVSAVDRTKIIVGSSVGTLLLVGVVVAIWIVLLRKKRDGEEDVEDYLDQLSGMPKRFTYQELKVATGDFQKKLGEGGFGSVFEGNLENGEKIAVKRLDALGQGKKEFLAEVKTIGSIHHVNLVRLIGFCAEKLHRLLVYEYMCNGSLDKWIFYRELLRPPLDWQTRRIVILDIAKGLAYLHQECRQRIVHLDIKPQNILLDANVHAKISDFGLSKLIDRDQSQVVTTMRGTPGYLAPELFSSVITEKADVYSFGIVVMELVCGRKNLDRSQPECMHLLPTFMEKAQEDQLIDIVDKCSEDMQLHKSEAVEMMRVAVWCLQNDFTRRPSMSTVVKVIEGTMDVEADLDYSIQNPITMAARRREAELATASTLLPSVLSGPR